MGRPRVCWSIATAASPLWNSYAPPGAPPSISYRPSETFRPDPGTPVAVTRRGRPTEEQMLDIAFLALGLAWFAACLGYTAVCDRL
jgi:hypothetical protein